MSADTCGHVSYYLMREERMMNAFGKIVAASALTVIIAASANAQIVDGQMMYIQRSSYWTSFLLVLKTSVNTRASTTSAIGSRGALAFDFSPPNCTPTLKVIVPLGSVSTQDFSSTNVALSMRTDNGSRFDLPAELYTTMGDTSAMFTVQSSNQLMSAIGEMSRGRVLRMKSSYGWSPDGGGYDTFSMIGMTAAFRRAAEMCTNPAGLIR